MAQRRTFSVILTLLSLACFGFAIYTYLAPRVRPAPPNTPAPAATQSSVEFVGEQTGEREQTIKTALAQEFKKTGEVKRAYLARIKRANQAESVALCLSVTNKRSDALFNAIQKVMQEHMDPSDTLDLVYLEPSQEASIDKVCPAFYP